MEMMRDVTNELNGQILLQQRRLRSYAFLLAFASARLSFSAAITLSISPRCLSIAEIPMCLSATAVSISSGCAQDVTRK